MKLLFWPLITIRNNLLLKICYENVVDNALQIKNKFQKKKKNIH